MSIKNTKLLLLESFVSSLQNEITVSATPGLWHGKMGGVIFLFNCYQITKKSDYAISAVELLDSVYNDISNETSIGFASGLTGIGVGIEYILHNKYMEGSSDEILLDVDFRVYDEIDTRTLKEIGLRDGICGLGYYLYYRLKMKDESDQSLQTLKNKEYLIYLIDWIEDCFPKSEPDLFDVYFLMCKLSALNIMNFKVNKLLEKCFIHFSNKQIYNWNDVKNDYENLGIPILKLLNPWTRQKI